MNFDSARVEVSLVPTSAPPPLPPPSEVAAPPAPAAVGPPWPPRAARALIVAEAPAGARAPAPGRLASRPAAPPRDFPDASVRDALQAIVDSYVDELPLPFVVVQGLAFLRRSEPAVDIRLTDAADGVEVWWAGSKLQTYRGDPGVDGQLQVARAVVDLLAQRSRRIGILSNQDLRERFIGAATAALDPYSRHISREALAEMKGQLLGPPGDPSSIEDPAATAGPAAAPSPATISEVRLVGPGKDVALLQLEAFGATTADELLRSLAPLRERGVDKLVIDLRANNGGLTAAAAAGADLFAPSGEVLSLHARDPVFEDIRQAKAGDRLEGMKIVLLIGDHTISAAEIFTADLADLGLAVAVGTTSYGKGVAQWIKDLPSGEGVALTVGRLQGPTGAPLDGIGVVPAVPGDQPPGTARLLGVGDDDRNSLRGIRFGSPTEVRERVRKAWTAAHPRGEARDEDVDDELATALAILGDSALYARAAAHQRELAARVSSGATSITHEFETNHATSDSPKR